jgi:hypothetical protein
VGTFKGRWVNEELLAALDAGAKVVLGVQAVFEPAPFLRPFVETFYGLRKRAIDSRDSFRAYAWKTLLNSCYGKLIETIERNAIIYGRDVLSRELEAGKDVYPTPIAGLYSIKSEEQGPFRHVAAGAAITARSRLLLYRRLLECAQKGRIYYADTDSILTDVRLDAEPDELGNLKLEAEVTRAHIVAPKVYRIELAERYWKKDEQGRVTRAIFRCKGIPIREADDAASEKRFAQYVNASKSESGTTGALGARKEGVTGFLSDVKRGNIAMSKAVLYRGLRKEDSKRRHGEGDSLPVSM